MQKFGAATAVRIAVGLCAISAALSCGHPADAQSAFTLTVESSNPATGVAIGVSPADKTGATEGSTKFTRTYGESASITLTAPAKAGGNNFSAWEGCKTANSVTCKVTLTANATVIAKYTAPKTYVLTVESADPASGAAISVYPADRNGASKGTTKFTRTYIAGTPVTLTAPSQAGENRFAAWSGCKTASGLTCKVAMSANQTVVAKYATPKTYALTVESAEPGSGVAIGVSPADKTGATHGTTKFTRSYIEGTTVTLTAPLKSGNNKFDEWTGCKSASTVTCKVAMNANETVTARFAPPTATAPTVTVTPAAKSITPSQSLNVAIAVSGGSGKPTPTGTVALTSGTYSSTATLSSGTVTITIAAGALAQGTDTLMATYTPKPASAAIYKSASGTAKVTVTAPQANYTLTVDSAHPASGITINAYPADKNNTGYGTTPFTLTYKAGTTVQLTAVSPSDGYSFLSWSGCASSTSGGGCSVSMNGNITVTASYNQANITGVKITPAAATVGATVQFVATVQGTGSFSDAVTWRLSCPSCGSLSPGTLSSTGLYITPFPAPPSVTVTASSVQAPSVSGSVTVTLSLPATAAGPVLTVDASKQTHSISPYIYGMNAYALQTPVAQNANITVARWGGDNTSRYNYKTNTSNSASDWYFENGNGTGIWPDGNFDDFVTAGADNGIKALGTVPLLGWVTNSNPSACSFPATTYPSQFGFDPYNSNCGDGEYTNQTNITGNNPAVTSMSEPPPAPPAASDATPAWADTTWAGGWVASLVANSKTGSSGGVAFWDLDNEPAWWDAVHRDVHPAASTYDEVTEGGIGTALAIKTADPTAQVNGPVIDYWWNYFYSKKDIESGWNTGPCYEPWQNPIDRRAHGGVPMIEYYLQQFKAAAATYGVRLLDYVELHTYFAATYNGSGVGLTTAGDTGEQEARLNSTRVFWDPTYTDPNYPQPNYTSDSNYTASCSTPLQAPQLIPMMQTWVSNDYPGTKTAITEYNWGGQESINGAVAQADLLGIFGAYGLDLATLWGPPDPSSQAPGMMAFEMYRNYDGKKSTFGDVALAATSGDQAELAIYGGLRMADGAMTVMVINKTYGALTATVSLENYTASAGATAQVYQYSNANLNAILTPSPLAIAAPSSGGTTSTVSATFPGQSITLLVVGAS